MSRVQAVFITALVFSSLLLLPVGPAAAVPTLIFDQQGTPLTIGTVSWNGSMGGPLVGTNIIFNTIRGLGTLAHDGDTLSCDGDCLLNFVTGAYLGGGEWDSGGSFIMTGDIVAIGNDPQCSPEPGPRMC